MSELPFDQLITALGNWSRGIPDIRAREPEALVTRVIDAMTSATQRAEAAEAERGKWESRAMSMVQFVPSDILASDLQQAAHEFTTLRAEREALRKVDDAMVERASIAAFATNVPRHGIEWEFCVTHIQDQWRNSIRAALTAAMGVQP